MLQDFLSKYSARDQKIIFLGVFFIALWLVYLLVVEPLLNMKSENQDDLIANKELLSWMQDSADKIRASGQSVVRNANGAGSSAVVVVEQVLIQNGLETPTRIEPNGSNKAIVQYDKVEFNKLLFALDKLKNNFGIEADSIKITNTAAEGLVKANINLLRDI